MVIKKNDSKKGNILKNGGYAKIWQFYIKLKNKLSTYYKYKMYVDKYGREVMMPAI